MRELWTLMNSVDGTCLYAVDSEAEALKWCHADYGGANVIRPMRVYTVPLYPEHALREARLAVLRDIRAAIPANMASDKPYRPVNLGWSQCAETMRQIIDAAMNEEGK